MFQSCSVENGLSSERRAIRPASPTDNNAFISRGRCGAPFRSLSCAPLRAPFGHALGKWSPERAAAPFRPLPSCARG